MAVQLLDEAGHGADARRATSLECHVRIIGTILGKTFLSMTCYAVC